MADREVPARVARWDNLKPHMFAPAGEDWLKAERLFVSDELEAASSIERDLLRRALWAAQDLRELIYDIQALAESTNRTAPHVMVEYGIPRNAFSRWKNGQAWMHLIDYHFLRDTIPNRNTGQNPSP